MVFVPHRPTAEWLRHPLDVAGGPLPRGALLRAPLTTGPLLAAGVATHHVPAGVLAALGAMLATINDRPGTRRTRLVRIGVPGLAVAVGFLLGALLAAVAAPGGAVPTALWIAPVVALAGYLSGSVSAIGPVASAAGLQSLVALLLGAGLRHQGPAWQGAAQLAAGAGWLLLLSALAALPAPRRRAGRVPADSEERAAVAATFDALGDVLRAVGTQHAENARRTLTAALDRAQSALDQHRWRPESAGQRRLRAQLSVAADAAEAAVTLLWEGEPVPGRVADAPLRLAHAVRTGRPGGPLAAPASDTPGRRALHEALKNAAEIFGTPGRTVQAPPRVPVREQPGLRRAFGPLGREYALRVAVITGGCTAVAQLLRPEQWYWLPITAAFLAKPDLGPLFSRAANRLIGTAVGVMLFAVLMLLPGTDGPVAAAALGGALLPLAIRHFALQTAALTPIVLAFAELSGTPGAPGARLVDTLLGCTIAVAAGFAPRLGGRRAAVAVHWAAALSATESYLSHVVNTPLGEGRRAERLALRRAAYRALAEARTVVGQAAAELPPAAVDAQDWISALGAVERLVDATTACAVRREHGARPLPGDEGRRLVAALADLARDAGARRRPDWLSLPDPAELDTRCATLADVAEELHTVRRLAPAA